MDTTSAPENPSVLLSNSCISMPPSSPCGVVGIFFRWLQRICSLEARSGGGTYILRSMRPGRSRAASSMSGRLVAATTTTLAVVCCTPSISVSSWDSTRSLTPTDESPLLVAKASISSKNIKLGAAARARLKRVCTAFSLSPSHLDNSSGPLTARKFIPLSVASAFAISVLEQPGGPYSNTPRGGAIFIMTKSSGCKSGHSTTSRRDCFTDSIPPISPQRTSGTSMATSLMALGVTRPSALSKSCLVIL
mmetsp:Transcript_5623/g.9204  ORF Transcript_5623/g.9204 Transcript_5623/m.9204 type:complete len:249 (+) Transcript_5623:210-956(+)